MVKIAKKCIKDKELKFKKDILRINLNKFSYLFFYFAIYTSIKKTKMFDKIFKGLNWGGGFLFLKK